MGAEGLLAAGLSIAGGIMQVGGAAREAKANSRLAILELQGQWEQVGIQDEQLLREADTIKTAAAVSVEERYQQLAKIKTNNALFMTISGLSENLSEGVADRESARAAAHDVRLIGYQAASQRRNIADQITVNRMALQYGNYRAATTISQGTAKTIGVGQQALISFGQTLLKYAGPSMSQLASLAGGG